MGGTRADSISTGSSRSVSRLPVFSFALPTCTVIHGVAAVAVQCTAFADSSRHKSDSRASICFFFPSRFFCLGSNAARATTNYIYIYIRLLPGESRYPLCEQTHCSHNVSCSSLVSTSGRNFSSIARMCRLSSERMECGVLCYLAVQRIYIHGWSGHQTRYGGVGPSAVYERLTWAMSFVQFV